MVSKGTYAVYEEQIDYMPNNELGILNRSTGGVICVPFTILVLRMQADVSRDMWLLFQYDKRGIDATVAKFQCFLLLRFYKMLHRLFNPAISAAMVKIELDITKSGLNEQGQ